MSRLPELMQFTLLGPVYAHQLPAGSWRVLHGDLNGAAVFVSDADFKRLYGPYNADTGHLVQVPEGKAIINGEPVEVEPQTELAVAIAEAMAPAKRPGSVTIRFPLTPSSAMRPNAVGKHGKGASIAFNREKARLRKETGTLVSSYLNGIARPWPFFPDNAQIKVSVMWEKVRSAGYPNGRYRSFVDAHDALPLMTKPIVDALVDGGILDDDRNLQAEYEQGKDPDGQGYVEITLSMPEDQP